MAEKRNAAVLELRTLLLESESESIVSSEMIYSHRRGQGRAKRDAFTRYAPQLYPYWLVYATAAYPPRALEGPPSVTGLTEMRALSRIT
jgi:hypothetical protein